MPHGLANAYVFAALNALSFQMILGSPMILYAKALDARSTVLGIISGMMPLLVIFQIPAASHIPRFGYKRFVYGGWGIRIVFIFLMALVPLTAPFSNNATQLAVLLFLLFGFNLSRGISSCAWLPWIASLVPAEKRGRYLARDAACVNVASCVAMLLAAALLGTDPRSWQFAIVFGFSAVMGVVSLVFLKRIPEGHESSSSEQTRASTHRVPWLEMARYAPFRKLLQANMGWAIAYGGLAAFTVAFLKVEIGMSEATILLVNSVAFLGGLSSLWLMANRLDRFGSKPVLAVSLLAWLIIMTGWVLLAGRLIPATLPIVVALQFGMGLFAALVNMANTRLAMATIPVMGRNHFFAIYSVVANVSLGCAPIAWGLLLDALRPVTVRWDRFEWNRFTLFFVLATVCFGVTLALCRRLVEKEAAGLDELLRELLVQSPQRFWLRFWPRS